MFAICIAAQNIVKKCKECGKPIASCQYKGKHPSKTVPSPHSMNNMPNVLPDYSQLNIGDYFYSDGTVSRVKKNSPQPIGVVFSLTPSDDDKKRGWCHGYIMALSDAKKGRCEWGPYQDIKGIPNYDFYVDGDAYRIIKDYNGYDYCNNIEIKRTRNNAFWYARNYPKRIPDFTSGWFLPSVGQWCDIIKNLGKSQVIVTKKGIGFDANIVLPNLYRYDLGTDEDYCTYWTSNENDNHGWFVVLLHQLYEGDFYNFDSVTKKTTRTRVRAIAAF